MWSGELEEAVCNNQALQCERSLIELQQFHIGQTAPHMHQWSLLHFAAEYNAFDAALVLFSHGADPHAKDQVLPSGRALFSSNHCIWVWLRKPPGLILLSFLRRLLVFSSSGVVVIP
eukprot:m.518067 g.518067  ORF g.518067 m.518067 type:complete len:117 (+) comp57483_c0_seq23:868-1218(+)